MKRCFTILLWIVLLAVSTFALEQEAKPAGGQFIRDWQIAGPFAADGILQPVVTNEESIAPVFGGRLNGMPWTTLKSPSDAIDLADEKVLGRSTKCVAFACAEIESEREGDVILGLGSDDGVMAWWNGRQVLVNDVLRGVTAGQDQVRVKMLKGKNTLLLKIFNDAGGWGYAADLRPAGTETWAWRAVLPMTEDEFLDLVERKSFDYFWNEADPDTGMTPDTVPAVVKPTDFPASVAAVGFGLTAICIGESRGWVSRADARERVVKTLKFMLENTAQEHGFFYHWVDAKTGKPSWNSEVSSVDTAWYLAGAITCDSYFNDGEIHALVMRTYERVDWKWMLDGSDTLSMGWNTGSGFIKHRWDVYSEHMILYLLAIGAPSNAISAESWYAWKRPLFTYEGMTYVQAVPLFLHQYAQAWVDFEGKRDAIADYFKNSALATKAHRAFCLKLSDRFPGYTERLWGLTASKGPKGYMVWGGPPPTMEYPIDGTVVPCSAGGSIPFVPDLTLPVLRECYDKYRRQTWGRYGLIDAFNPNTGWVADGYIGIDVGPTLLMAENYRTRNVWKWFMQSPEIEKAMKLAGFKETGRDLEKADLDYLRQLARETWDCMAYFVYPETGMPYDTSARGKNTSASNIGLYLASLAIARDMGFIPAEESLARAQKLLASVEKFPSWKGFAQCWHGVDDLQPSQDDIWVSVVDTGNLALGLVVAAQAFPELSARCDTLLNAMDWGALYDTNACQLYGGYDMKNLKLNPDWRVDALATDSRGAAFMAVASGKVPADVWAKLARLMDERGHVKFLKPGWVGGGLFMQYLTGIFLDERDTLAGRSAANLAYDNMRHADTNNLPAWGWSSCDNPDGGYIGWGKLRDDVVTPHASVLAIEDFPKEVVANLYKLQRLGVRAPWEENGKKHAFGFRDSVNLTNGHVSANYLVFDQGMLFLSLANFLENGIVRRYFHANSGVQAAVKAIPELAKPEGGANTSVFEPGLGAFVSQEQIQRKLDVRRVAEPPVLDGDLAGWPTDAFAVVRFPDQAEFGVPPKKERFEGAFSFAWDDTYLYVAADVKEDDLVCEAPASEIYKDDAIELFVDPKNDGFVWGNSADFQIGISPSGPEGKPQMYSWFQKTVPPENAVASKVSESPAGAAYKVEFRIPWSFLGVTEVRAGTVVPLSFALHTVDKARLSSAKINWSYRSDVDKIYLGELKLTE